MILQNRIYDDGSCRHLLTTYSNFASVVFFLEEMSPLSDVTDIQYFGNA